MAKNLNQIHSLINSHQQAPKLDDKVGFKSMRLPFLLKKLSHKTILSNPMQFSSPYRLINISFMVAMGLFVNLGINNQAQAQDLLDFDNSPRSTGVSQVQLAQTMPQQNPAINVENLNPMQIPLSQQVVGADSELINVGELLGINIMAGGPGAGPEYMTLNDTIFALIKNNRKMKADLMSLYGSKLSIDKAEVEYMPEAVISGKITQNGLKPEEDDVTNEIEGGKWNGFVSNSLSITVKQKLYDFGYRAESIKAAEADYKRQEASFRATLEDKMMEIITLYGELRQSIIQYRSINDYFAQGLELYKVVKDRTDNDLAPQSELDYVQLQLAETRQQLTQIASRITQGKRAFEQEIGYWPQQLAPMPSVAVERISQLVDVNLPTRRSAQVQEIYAEVEKRKAELALVDARDKPSLGLEVSGTRTTNDGNSDTTDYSANGLLNMSWTLYDGGRNDIARQQALYQLKQSKYALNYLGERAKGDSLRRLIEVKQADREIEIVKSMIASSDQIIRHNTRLFQAGLVSATFMIGSLRERSFYKVRLVVLEHTRSVSSFGYAYAMGILPAQLGVDIDEVIANFDANAEPTLQGDGAYTMANDIIPSRSSVIANQ